MTAAERISSLVILPSLVLIGWAKLPSSMEVPSNNPSFCFPIPLSGCGITLWAVEGGHARASWNISYRGQRKDRASSPGVLPLNETGGKLTYRVIVTNIAEGG